MSNSSGKKVGQILDTSSAYWKSCAIHAGVKLDIFTVINDGFCTAKEIAGRIDTDERGTMVLLNALSAMDLLVKENDRYANTMEGKQLLVKGSPDYLGYIILHHHHLVDAWAQLDTAIKTGEAVVSRSHGEEKERESFLMGMFNLAVQNAPRVAEQVPLAGCRRLLDLGGGPGTYAIFFCQKNPGLTATIFDRETTRPFAMKTVKRYNMGDRIDFISGDFTRDPLGKDYDVAWLSQILHSNGPEACQRIIDSTAAALAPGGRILIHEFFLEESLAAPLFPALFSLNMLLNNGTGRSYSFGQITAMLQRAGVRRVERLPFAGPNHSAILAGTL
ncbi:MAG: SAM-dependent methyltransferase [Desulfurivibrio sp.]|jgi:SAM-dependent methyltransferase|nr:MAG: SAM-dependent methyltransferase [Desulfurivibrio sp.]